ncbi:MAG: glutathione S-transferase [Congregibacter sp.]|nr:glutathione S-transferase [Congregibacter sp.]
MNQLPVLYSFRRCPYAIRARMAIACAGMSVELREVVLKDKPEAMLAASQKGTVPVLVMPDGNVIDESIDVMRWALNQEDPQGWLRFDDTNNNNGIRQGSDMAQLIAENDGPFKRWLDKYKYADRHPEHPAHWYRDKACVFLDTLEVRLKNNDRILDKQLSFTDVAIFPFVRQFAMVDEDWFDQSPYPQLRRWLRTLLDSPVYTRVMPKYPKWIPGQRPVMFPTLS